MKMKVPFLIQKSIKRVERLATLFVVCFLFSSTALFGQQTAQTSLYNQNLLTYNPAYAGSKIGLYADGSFRYQWLDLEGAPVSQFLSAHMAIPKYTAGFGFSLVNDRIGAENNFSVNLAFSKWLDLGRLGLSLGLDAGIAQKSLDGTALVTPEGSYNSLSEPNSHTDSHLITESNGSIALNLGAGIFIKSRFTEGGISVRNILPKKFSLGAEEDIIEEGAHFYGFLRHYFALVYNIDLIPSLLFKSDLVSHQLDAQIMAQYRDFIQFGIGFRGYNNRTQDALVFLAGYRVNKDLRIAYSYDLTLSRLQNFQSGSHEVGISYRFGSLLSPSGGKVRYNPRFL